MRLTISQAPSTADVRAKTGEAPCEEVLCPTTDPTATSSTPAAAKASTERGEAAPAWSSA